MRAPGGGRSGFSVDPAALDGAAGRLGRAYDDFQTVITDFTGPQCYDAAAFGDFGTGAAWQACDSRWAGEPGLTIKAPTGPTEMQGPGPLRRQRQPGPPRGPLRTGSPLPVARRTARA